MLGLDSEVLNALLAHRCSGRVADLILPDVWPVKPPPNRTTIWRWLRGEKFPRNADELFGLAGALDVDPVALLRLSSEMTFSRLCSVIAESIWAHQLTAALRRYWFLRTLFAPSRDWPPPGFAQKYFHRQWTKREHHHQASGRADYYHGFLLRAREPVLHQVWHFAWRDHLKGIWRPYGFVRRAGPRIQLLNFAGLEAIATFSQSDQQSFLVETWFGRGDADFCIASLHGFSMSSSKPGLSVPMVRFTVDHRGKRLRQEAPR